MDRKSVTDRGLAPAERSRIEALSRYKIVGTEPEERFDALTRLAHDLFGVTIAFMSVIDECKVWWKSSCGADPVVADRSETFCNVTIENDKPLIVLDACQHPQFSTLPVVTGEPFIRFYAGAPLITADGQRIGTFCIVDTEPRSEFPAEKLRILKDLASLAMNQIEMRVSEIVRASLLKFACDTQLSVITVDQTGRIEFANPSMLAMLGYAEDELIGQPIDVIVPERMRGAHEAGMARVVAGGQAKIAGRTVELAARRKDGTEIPIEFSLSTWKTEFGIGMGAIMRDISERRRRDQRLMRLAHHDTLTGLMNRHRFTGVLEECFLNGTPVSVLLLDLDGFKDINDTHGHAVGDTLLQSVAIRLSGEVPHGVHVARFGGDEFALLWPGNSNPVDIQALAASVLTAFDKPFEFGGHAFFLGTSIGFAVAPAHGEDPEELIASADFALYRAKQAGGRNAHMFQPDMRHAAIALMATQDELSRALRHGELELHYQPQVRLEDGRIFGLEALIRWQHPTRGLLLPGTFLPALEASALAVPVGQWVIDEACRQLAAWRDAGITGVRVGVNLFSAQFKAGKLVAHVRNTLAKYRLDPALLELELTETIALYSDDASLTAIQELRDLGVRLAFDDFGTGYASLSSLKRVPLTTLKIDRGFVRELLTNPQDAAITRAMIAMGNDLALETIVEGIETEEQERALRQLGCRAAQGYRYGRPMPAEQATDRLRLQAGLPAPPPEKISVNG